MLKSVWVPVAGFALFIAGAVLLPIPSQRAAAQSTGPYVSAVDLDIAPAGMDKYPAALKENGAASVKEPGCQRFDIMVVASNPNHVFIYEVYDNAAASQAHRATDHFKKYAATTATMVTKREVRPMTQLVTNSKSH
jgi:quinol monooxygenase YgiN